MEFNNKIIFIQNTISPIIKKFIDKLLNKKSFLILKHNMENNITLENIKKFLYCLSINIDKLLLKLNNINEYEFIFEINFLNDFHYPIIKLQFQKLFNLKIKNIIKNLNDNDILELINNFKNKKYLKYNNLIRKKLDYSLKNKITTWNEIILFNKVFIYRYTPQICIAAAY